MKKASNLERKINDEIQVQRCLLSLLEKNPIRQLNYNLSEIKNNLDVLERIKKAISGQ